MFKIVKWISRLILCLVILFVLAGVTVYLVNKSSEKPSIEKAPWSIQTYSNDTYRVPSRIYYATDVDIVEGVPVISNFWSFNGEKYKHEKVDREFPKEIYGDIIILRRIGE